MSSDMKIRAIAQWFGSNRTNSATVGKELGRLAWCGVPFMGGACELPYIEARSGVANDMHAHVINLARCIRNEKLSAELYERADAVLFHPHELKLAQRRCMEREMNDGGSLFARAKPAPEKPCVLWAADYMVCSWFGRGGHSGIDGEFRQSQSTRYSPGGGSSIARWRSAVDGILNWHHALKRWEFECIDAIEFLSKAHDRDDCGLYVDAPWPDDGDKYTNRFPEQHQRNLAEMLNTFQHARIVIRYGDHPLIRELYPEDRWKWVPQTSKDMHGGEVSEVLIINGPSYTEGQR